MKSGKFHFGVLGNCKIISHKFVLSYFLKICVLHISFGDVLTCLITSVFQKSGNSVIEFTLVYFFWKCAHFESTISPFHEINHSLDQLNIFKTH